MPLHAARHSRAKRLSLRLCAKSGSFRLTLPARATYQHAQDFLLRSQVWIDKQAAKLVDTSLPFVPDTHIPFAGQNLILRASPVRHVQHDSDILLVPADPLLFASRTRRWLIAQAKSLLETESQAMAATIGQKVKSVRVGDFRSRWGSCSYDARLSYSWRLILAPPDVRRSVVAHEVAHIVHHNHGPEFWELATHVLGQSHGPARQWLKLHGSRLMRYGQESRAAPTAADQ